VCVCVVFDLADGRTPRATAANDSSAGLREEDRRRTSPTLPLTRVPGVAVAPLPFTRNPSLPASIRELTRAEETAVDGPAAAVREANSNRHELRHRHPLDLQAARLAGLTFFGGSLTAASPAVRAPDAPYTPVLAGSMSSVAAAAAASFLCRPPVPGIFQSIDRFGATTPAAAAATMALWPAAIQRPLGSAPINESPTRPSDASSPAPSAAHEPAASTAVQLDRRSERDQPRRHHTSSFTDVGLHLMLSAAERYLTATRPATADSQKTSSSENYDAVGSDQSSSSSSSSRRPEAPPHFRCDACSKSYSTANGLTKHREFHCVAAPNGRARRQFVCPHCAAAAAETGGGDRPQPGKTYSSIGALKMHIRTHTLPCRCQLCGKAISRPWLLQGHLRTHTGEKPFRCPDCHRAFADRSNLRAHAQTHADVKRYQCQSCAKTFSRMSLLLKHKEHGTGCC